MISTYFFKLIYTPLNRVINLKNVKINNLYFENKLSDDIYTHEKTMWKYEYKPYEDRRDILSYIEDTCKSGHLSLTGTHNSMAYETKNISEKTQEFNISDQLKFGVHVFDVSLSINLNETFSNDLSFTQPFTWRLIQWNK